MRLGPFYATRGTDPLDGEDFVAVGLGPVALAATRRGGHPWDVVEVHLPRERAIVALFGRYASDHPHPREWPSCE